MTAITCGLLYLRALVGRPGRRLHPDESGQDLFEYVLLIGGVALVMVITLIVGFGELVPEVLGTLCPTVDPLGGGSAGDCLP